MKLWPILVALPLAFAATLGEAQVYRWIDADGKVHYTDQPPPPGAKNVQQKKVLTGAAEDDGLPYAVREASRNFPVVLYNSDCGEYCTKARQLLNSRGVPFAEKTPQQPAEAEALKKLTGGVLEVPVLRVGKNTLRGFDEGEWNQELDAAGYPRTVRPRPAKPTAVPTAADTSAGNPNAAKNFPVTMYTADCGGPCTKGKELLVKRGIPFTEKDAQDPANQEALRKLIGPDLVVPVIIVGSVAVKGFDEAVWNNALDLAGYPKARQSGQSPAPSQPQ